jgi:hypothetical protein
MLEFTYEKTTLYVNRVEIPQLSNLNCLKGESMQKPKHNLYNIIVLYIRKLKKETLIQ